MAIFTCLATFLGQNLVRYPCTHQRYHRLAKRRKANTAQNPMNPELCPFLQKKLPGNLV